MSKLKNALKARLPVAGMHVTLIDSSITELCGYLDYDFIWIDTEHTAIDHQILQQHIIAASSAGTESLVRVPWNDPIFTKRVLEMGPTGVIFPMINNATELDAAMKSTLYPPNGTRGFGPIRAVKYGLENIDHYINIESLNLVRCVQIESKEAVENLSEMSENPWVDCFIFGLSDLSGTLGKPNQVFDEETNTLLDKALQILKRSEKSIGISTGSDELDVLKHWFDKGINFISAGTDYLHILKGAQKVSNILRNIQS